MVRKALIVLALAAVPASAQQTNTTCQQFGAVVHCNSNTTPPVQQYNWLNDFNRNLQQQAEQNRRNQENTQRIFENIQRKRELERQQSYARAQAENEASKARLADIHKAIVSDSIRKGDCKGAMDFALAVKDLQLAGQVKQICG